MTVDGGLGRPTPQPRDLAFSEAVDLAQRDYARLLHMHSPSWSLDLAGEVVWRCECSRDVPRNAAALDKHILTEVRRARGPVRGPTKR
jgi:hypothetical protein